MKNEFGCNEIISKTEKPQEININEFEEKLNTSIQKGKEEIKEMLDKAIEFPSDMLID